jgi:Mn2+/Fe2+ NRAMP family transporter
MFLTLPFMAAIQIISACIGWRRGLARNLAQQMPAPVLFALVTLLVVANTINIAADLAAMAQALRLVIGGPVLVCLLAEVFIPDHRYAGYLKFLSCAAGLRRRCFQRRGAMGRVLSSTVVPTLSLDRDYLPNIVAVFGTTLGPCPFN